MKFTCLPMGVCGTLFFLTALGQSGVVKAATLTDPQEIIRKSVAATKADWAEANKYSYVERDVISKRNSPRTSKTYRVLMIDGSPYNFLIAVNNQPLSASARAAEQRKLQKEINRRQNESDWSRRRRVAKYQKDNEHDHQMLQEMINAFQFRLAGQAQIDGHDCWVMDAEPKPGFQPADREGRVLAGMRGRLWIDMATYQWVRVRADVIKPVSFFGFLAKVGPGTEFQLQQKPVGDNVWMPARFNMKVNATALGFIDESSLESDTYRDYRLMPEALALLQSTK